MKSWTANEIELNCHRNPFSESVAFQERRFVALDDLKLVAIVFRELKREKCGKCGGDCDDCIYEKTVVELEVVVNGALFV